MRWALLAVLLAGCATAYQPKGLKGGYEETRIKDDLVEVRFYGNAFTDSAFVRHAAILRACEYTLESGHDWFVPVDASFSTQQGALLTPGQTHTNVTAYGNTATATSYSTPAYVTPVNKHQASILIQIGSGDMPHGAIDAEEVSGYLSKEIK